jgi:hypothetical protein
VSAALDAVAAQAEELDALRREVVQLREHNARITATYLGLKKSFGEARDLLVAARHALVEGRPRLRYDVAERIKAHLEGA